MKRLIYGLMVLLSAASPAWAMKKAMSIKKFKSLGLNKGSKAISAAPKAMFNGLSSLSSRPLVFKENPELVTFATIKLFGSLIKKCEYQTKVPRDAGDDPHYGKDLYDVLNDEPTDTLYSFYDHLVATYDPHHSAYAYAYAKLRKNELARAFERLTEEQKKDPHFRKDLYYVLNTVPRENLEILYGENSFLPKWYARRRMNELEKSLALKDKCSEEVVQFDQLIDGGSAVIEMKSNVSITIPEYIIEPLWREGRCAIHYGRYEEYYSNAITIANNINNLRESVIPQQEIHDASLEILNLMGKAYRNYPGSALSRNKLAQELDALPIILKEYELVISDKKEISSLFHILFGDGTLYFSKKDQAETQVEPVTGIFGYPYIKMLADCINAPAPSDSQDKTPEKYRKDFLELLAYYNQLKTNKVLFGKLCSQLHIPWYRFW
jgi:hypothetical protein